MRRMLLIILCVFAAYTSACYSTPPNRTHTLAVQRVSEVRYVMGTLLDITIYAPSPQEGRVVLDRAFGIAEHLDSVLSTWNPASAVSVFNNSNSIQPQHVAPELYDVVTTAHTLSVLTDNAFSVTIRPLVTLWEYAKARNQLPQKVELDRIQKLITPENIRIEADGRLTKTDSNAAIETGGIGKGYAVDKIVAYLKEQNIHAGFINFGRSSIAAIGTPPGQSGWPVSLELEEGMSDGNLLLRDETLTVSRVHGNPIIIDNIAYGHIFDPLTAQPVPSRRGAAIRSASATEGEALVKYLIVRGLPPITRVQKWPKVSWALRERQTLTHSDSFFNRPI